MKIEQIKSQLGRIILVHKVVDLTSEGAFVSRELIFVKVKSKGEKELKHLEQLIFLEQKLLTVQNSLLFLS